MLEKVYVCYHENSRELFNECGGMSDLFVTADFAEVYKWFLKCIKEGVENEYAPLLDTDKLDILGGIFNGKDGRLALYNKQDECSPLNYELVVEVVDLNKGLVSLNDEKVLRRLERMHADTEKAAKMVEAFVTQIKTDSEPYEDIGHHMIEAIINNNIDNFLISVCGWGIESLLNFAESGTEKPKVISDEDRKKN